MAKSIIEDTVSKLSTHLGESSILRISFRSMIRPDMQISQLSGTLCTIRKIKRSELRNRMGHGAELLECSSTE